MQIHRNKIIKAFILFIVFLPLLEAGCGISDENLDNSISQSQGIDEEEILKETYSLFYMDYIDNNSVHVPQKGDNLETYVESYSSLEKDIYTRYFDPNEMRKIQNHNETEENLVIKIYAPSTLYIAFDKFVEGTATRVMEKISMHINEGYNRLILDLRINGGGIVEESVALLEYFLSKEPEGTMLCRIDGQGIYQEYKLGETINSMGREEIFDYSNMYILTSGHTASASEIITAGLIYFNEATQIGSRTFGKNRVISIYQFTRGDGFEMTRAIVYHADNVDREGVGLSPENKNLSTDPFAVVANYLSIDVSDPLPEEWEISDEVLSNLYSQDYWRDQEYYACSYLYIPLQ